MSIGTNRKRRMNAALNGLGFWDESGMIEAFGGDDAQLTDAQVNEALWAQQDIGYDDPAFNFVFGDSAPNPSDFFTTVAAEPKQSLNMDLIGQVVKFGTQVYQYTQGSDASGRRIAIPRRVAQGQTGGLLSSPILPIAAIAAIFLLNN